MTRPTELEATSLRLSSDRLRQSTLSSQLTMPSQRRSSLPVSLDQICRLRDSLQSRLTMVRVLLIRNFFNRAGILLELLPNFDLLYTLAYLPAAVLPVSLPHPLNSSHAKCFPQEKRVGGIYGKNTSHSCTTLVTTHT